MVVVFSIIILIFLLFHALIGSGQLCYSSLVLFSIYIHLCYLSDSSVYVSWMLPDYSIFGIFVCFIVVICVFSTI